LTTDQFSFLLNTNKYLREAIRNSELRLGDVADCVTGFYSGDNKNYLRGEVSAEKVELKPHLIEDILNGIRDKEAYVEIVKGRGDPLINQTSFYVKWDTKSVDYYKTTKKPRFQNPDYYFGEGIGVPMVKSKKLKAFLLERRLFDQSVVGIFPKNKKHVIYLLLFLNSSIANKLINSINHTSNNSANYLKRVPVLLNEEHIIKAEKIFKKYSVNKNLQETLKEADRMFESIYS